MDVKAQEEWLPRPLITEVNCTQIWNCKQSQCLSLKNALHIGTITLKLIFPPSAFSVASKVAVFSEPPSCQCSVAAMLQRCWWKKRVHFTWSWCSTRVLLLSCPKAWFHGSCQQTWLKKHSDLKDSLLFLMICLIKKLIEYQLSMSILPADMIFAQTSSDAYEASVQVGSGQGPSLRTHSTHLKPQQDTFENESLDWLGFYVS